MPDRTAPDVEADLELSPAEFDETKYTEHFPTLQAAYKEAFEEINDTHDSELVHAIDQQVLNESEPFYDEEEGFVIEVPDEPVARVAAAGLVVDSETVEAVLDEYVEAIEAALARRFGAAD
ncbi:MAG: DUF5783 family protein [Halobacteriaceae archaeon]